MSRSNYNDDCDGWARICWRGAVTKAMKGKRGQALLKDLVAALDAMPEKRLIADELVDPNGESCALGVLGMVRQMPNLAQLNPDDTKTVESKFNVAEALVREITYMNDEGHCWREETPEHRWQRMRSWVERQIIKATP